MISSLTDWLKDWLLLAYILKEFRIFNLILKLSYLE